MVEGKMNSIREGVIALITIGSTVAIPWGLLILKFVVGFITYFASRMLYRYFKDDIEAFIDSEVKSKKKKK